MARLQQIHFCMPSFCPHGSAEQPIYFDNSDLIIKLAKISVCSCELARERARCSAGRCECVCVWVCVGVCALR